MKINWNNKYSTISVYSILVILSGILIFMSMSNIDKILDVFKSILVICQPFIIGIVLAYLLNYFLKFYENNFLKTKPLNKLKPKSIRGLAIVCTYITAGMIVYLFVKIIFPQLTDSIVGLANSIPQYIANATTKVTEYFGDVDIPEEYRSMAMDKWSELVGATINIITNATPVIANSVLSITSSILNIIIGVIVSIYIMIDKERFIALTRKLMYAIFEKYHVKRFFEIAERSNGIFGRFIGGTILDSLIVGALTFIIMIVLKMPYALLVSVIISLTNVIPVFGPFIGAVPCFIIIFFVSPQQALLFLIVIVIIQQIDGNIIAPYILGDSVGLSAFWILFSVLVFSKFLGVIGMIIGVPVFAVIYSIIKETVEHKLNKRGLPIDTMLYVNDDVVYEKNTQIKNEEV